MCQKKNKKNLDAVCVGMTQTDSLAVQRCGDIDLMQVIQVKGERKVSKSVTTQSLVTFLSKDICV